MALPTSVFSAKSDQAHTKFCLKVRTLVVPYWRSAAFWPLISWSEEQFVKDSWLVPAYEDLVLPGLSGNTLPSNTAIIALRLVFGPPDSPPVGWQ